jgi:cell division protein FtsB
MPSERQSEPQHETRWNPFENVSENQAQVVAVVVLLTVVVLIIGGLYLAQATTNITTVRDIEQLKQERGRLQRGNEQLKAQIAELQSIDNLMTRAATLGFQPAGPEDMQYLIVDGYEYRKPTVVPTQVRMTPTPQTYDEDFAGWLKEQFDSLRNQFEDWAD